MQYEINKHYPFSELAAINAWWNTHREYDVNEYREPREYETKQITETDKETGEERVVREEQVLVERDYDDYVEIVPRDEKLVKQDRIIALKAELAKIKEDIEQEAFGLVRDDFAEKKARAAAVVNELRVLEGKEPREVRGEA